MTFDHLPSPWSPEGRGFIRCLSSVTKEVLAPESKIGMFHCSLAAVDTLYHKGACTSFTEIELRDMPSSYKAASFFIRVIGCHDVRDSCFSRGSNGCFLSSRGKNFDQRLLWQFLPQVSRLLKKQRFLRTVLPKPSNGLIFSVGVCRFDETFSPGVLSFVEVEEYAFVPCIWYTILAIGFRRHFAAVRIWAFLLQ